MGRCQSESLWAADIRVKTIPNRARLRFRTVRETVDSGIPVDRERRRTPNAWRVSRTYATVESGFAENLNMDQVYQLAAHLSRFSVRTSFAACRSWPFWAL